MSTKLYSYYGWKIGPIKTIRHVMTPSANLTYFPDLSYQEVEYYDQDSTLKTYSPIENGIFGGPSSTRQFLLNLSVGNTTR